MSRIGARIQDLGTSSKVRRSLFYRFGPVALDEYFDLALSLSEAETAQDSQSIERLTSKFIDEIKKGRIDIVISVGKSLEEIKRLKNDGFNPARLKIEQTFWMVLLNWNRLPSKEELRKGVGILGPLGVGSEANSTDSFPDPEALRRKFDHLSSSEWVLSKDAFRDLSQNFSWELLDGNKFRRYRTLFGGMFKNVEPDIVAFSRRAREKWSAENVVHQERTFGELIDVLRTPMSLDPFGLWSNGFSLINTLISESELLDQGGRTEISDFYRTFLTLGLQLEWMIGGIGDFSLDPNLLQKVGISIKSKESPFVSLEGHRYLRKLFYNQARELKHLPDFSDFWLDNKEVATWLGQCDQFDSAVRRFFTQVAVDLGRLQAKAATISLGELASRCSAFGKFAEVLKPVFENREHWIYFEQLQRSGGK